MKSDAVNISGREVGDDKGPSLAKIQTSTKRTCGDGIKTPYLKIKQPGHLELASAPSMQSTHNVRICKIPVCSTPILPPRLSHFPISKTFNLLQ
jgi:hypothetical protein